MLPDPFAITSALMLTSVRLDPATVQVDPTRPRRVSGSVGGRPLTGSVRGRPFTWAVFTVSVGLIVTGVLTWLAWSQYNQNENRLLSLRTREAGSVLSSTLPAIETPLASAAELAEITHGNVAQFQQYMASYVGTGKSFVSASLWPVHQSPVRPLAVEGVAPDLASGSVRATNLFSGTSTEPLLRVIGLLHRGDFRLGYAYFAPGSKPSYAVYAESALPEDRRSPISSTSAFSGLNYALYLARSARSVDLLATSSQRLPLAGRTSSTVVPFGDNAFDLVMSPKAPLGGDLAARLPWILAVTGGGLSLVGGIFTERLIRRRRDAEQLALRLDQVAKENERLYAEQRDLAEGLQHALLPEVLPEVDQLEIGARYVPGVEGLEIGGDWYDVIAIDDQHTLLVVGDVSGRGLRAATVMASLRYTIRAYAAQHDSPEVIITKLSSLMKLEEGDRFATVLGILIDTENRELVIVNAGHLPPLLLDDSGGNFLTTALGVPAGILSPGPYSAVTVAMPAQGTLVAYTDGLVERRGENLDVGLNRLHDVAVEADGSLDGLLTALVSGLADDGNNDDTAILAVRWTE